MESQTCKQDERKILQHLGNLREMIVHHHELENLSEFVLHDLCTGPCFHVDKAAYFINNPDFKLLRGVTGHSKQEPQSQIRDSWNNQKQFIASMKDSAFNQKVRNSSYDSFEKGRASEKYIVQKLADQLEIENPAYHIWDLKHANHGLLIYEPLLHGPIHGQDHMMSSLYYLSFCPVY